MIYTYASSYISGFGKPVEIILKKQISDVVIVKHLDGLIVYKTQKKLSEIKLSCFNNTYMVLAMDSTNSKNSYEDAIKKFVNKSEFDFKGVADNIHRGNDNTFKILPFDGNLPTSIDFGIIKELENRIKQKFGLKLGIKKHDFDIVLSRRSEGLVLLLFKLTYDRKTEKDLQHGALRPELCNILAWISDIKSDDIIMDPFCGHGSIPKEIVKHFKYNMLFASDIDADLIDKLKSEFKKNKKNLFIKQRDALNLGYFQDGFFDKIITDPPWNIYNSKDKDFSVFYEKILQEFSRILKSGGICTILMGNAQDFDQALANTDFKLNEKYHILVNGKKANVYKLIKI